MANLSLREVNQSKLETTPIVEGQLVFCYDTGNIYHDTTSGRTQVGHDVFNVTELPLAPLNGKVYCLPDGEMLLYLGDWVKLNYKYDVATETEDGLQSAEDKEKLNGIEEGANKYVHPTNSGNKHIPAGGAAGQILRWKEDGTATWGADKDTTYTNFVGATANASGKAGLVPAPNTGAMNLFLRSDGTWGSVAEKQTSITIVRW
jgi:hypothetical protein